MLKDLTGVEKVCTNKKLQIKIKKKTTARGFIMNCIPPRFGWSFGRLFCVFGCVCVMCVWNIVIYSAWYCFDLNGNRTICIRWVGRLCMCGNLFMKLISVDIGNSNWTRFNLVTHKRLPWRSVTATYRAEWLRMKSSAAYRIGHYRQYSHHKIQYVSTNLKTNVTIRMLCSVFFFYV